ncbi:hypothetical protein CAPTEDRAFT_190109 [Capitella teleta]|uniref:Sulfotransferase domain-containing protein n=1 Tax=Capitella teleta TaxID=283909 RepID=R7UKX7_CAPTE|nr:hypothetical protein CAPTEDRAFT_190109 [Capitella teleta]|eukprot:ELU07189.1 hypothetical protein CAPTEDRAFT_190109 [Capitella teleta]
MAAELTVGHRSHTLPKEYSVGGVDLSEQFAMPATLQALQRGDGSEYEFYHLSFFRESAPEFCDPSFEKCYGAEFTPPPGGFNVAKTHLPYHMMKEHANRDTKIIVGFRNPKDNLQAFEYNVGWWSIRDRPNTMFVNYEDLTEDPVKEVRRMAEFLGKEVSDEDIVKIVEWTAFGNMRDEKSTNYEALKDILDFKISPYMRKGTVGDWKNHFNEEENYKTNIEKQYEEICVPLGLKFRFEL